MCWIYISKNATELRRLTIVFSVFCEYKFWNPELLTMLSPDLFHLRFSVIFVGFMVRNIIFMLCLPCF
jgi:hypothetical protein